MEEFIHLLHYDQKKLAKHLITSEDMQSCFMEILQGKTDDTAKAKEFLQSNYCTKEVAASILNHFASLIVAGVNERTPTMFDMFLMSKVAYTFGVIETCCFDKIYK